MPEEELELLPESVEKYLDKPFRGLFGNSVHARVIQEIVADPHHDYRIKELEDLTGRSTPMIKRALSTLTELGIMAKDSRDIHRPIYRPNIDSKQLLALTFLAYAIHDDNEGTNAMDTALAHYCITQNRIQIIAGAFVAYNTRNVAGQFIQIHPILLPSTRTTGPSE